MVESHGQKYYKLDPKQQQWKHDLQRAEILKCQIELSIYDYYITQHKMVRARLGEKNTNNKRSNLHEKLHESTLAKELMQGGGSSEL